MASSFEHDTARSDLITDEQISYDMFPKNFSARGGFDS